MSAAIQHQLDALASRRNQQAQGSPRPARARFTVLTQGVGETRRVGAHGLSFGLFMLEEPSFTWGVAAQQPVGSDNLPLCTATVLQYKVNDAGLYVGADVGFRVYSNDANIKLKFYLTFEASSLRATTGLSHMQSSG